MAWAGCAHRMVGLGRTSGLIGRVATGSSRSIRQSILGGGHGDQRIPGYLTIFSSNLHNQSLSPEPVNGGINGPARDGAAADLDGATAFSGVDTSTLETLQLTASSHLGSIFSSSSPELTFKDFLANALKIGQSGSENVGDVAASAGKATLENLPSGALSPLGSLFSSAPPVLGAQDLFTQLHDIPGMDWTKSIILTTLGIRLLVGLPLAVFQQKSLAKLENLQPQIKELAKDLSRETSIAVKIYNWNERKAKSAYRASFKRHWRKIVEDNNCHPMRTLLLGFLQVPFWVCYSGALRNVVYAIPEPRTSEMILHWMQMAGESPFWIESLASVDPYILPLVFLTANLINIQINSMRKLTVPQTKLQKVVPWVFRGGVVGITVLAAFTPSAVTMYWAISSVCALLQNLLMKAPPVRRFFRIPSTPTNP